MKALVVAGGDLAARAALDVSWPGWADGIDLVVGADGGALGAERLGFRPDLVVGDADSLAEADVARLRADGIRVEIVPVDKDESDTELALRAALDAGADRIVVLGAFGGPRLDHAIANLGLLALPALDRRSIELLDAGSRVTLLRAPGPDGRPVRRVLDGPVGGLVSLLPLGPGVEGVTTEGLRYPLHDEPLPPGPARGLSNVRLERTAAVTLGGGLLLIVESPPA